MYCKKFIKRHFNKNLIISEEEEHLFQQSNSCWICEKLIDNDDEKVRDHCHVTGKFRGAAHWICNKVVKTFRKRNICRRQVMYISIVNMSLLRNYRESVFIKSRIF